MILDLRVDEYRQQVMRLTRPLPFPVHSWCKWSKEREEELANKVRLKWHARWEQARQRACIEGMWCTWCSIAEDYLAGR
eukprot:10396060-Karenia_brevis.AAC.1